MSANLIETHCTNDKRKLVSLYKIGPHYKCELVVGLADFTALVGHDFETTDCTDNLVRIPHSITLNNDNVVQITFGYTSSDGQYADNPVSQSLLNAIVHALNEASSSVNINSVHISATSNGEHSPSSNHYKNRAVDISKINGQRIYNIQNSNEVKFLQEAFDSFPDIRENFGPSFNHKLGDNYDVGGHNDHLHISTNNCN